MKPIVTTRHRRAPLVALRRFRLATAIVATAAVILILGCGGGDDARQAPHSANSLAGSPVMDEIANATFGGIFEHEISLTSGLWEGEPVAPGAASRPSVGLVEHFSLEGDLDGDDSPETAVLLWESSGGSGTRLYVAVMASSQSGVEHVATALIGDRVQVRSGTIANREIVLDITRHGPQDPACCPTERALVGFALDGAGLTDSSNETTGVSTLADLEGRGWRLLVLGWNHPVPDDTTITFTVDGDRVAGSSGCNTYFGDITSPEPGRLEIGETGSTMMACPESEMELERDFLVALSQASSYSFLAGRLALPCDTDEGSTTLIFEAREVTE